MLRDQLVGYLDDFLQVSAIKDTADNGLQVEGDEQVHKVSFAVDACLEAFQRAHRSGAQMLVTHHGLFWGQSLLLRGVHRRRMAFLLEHNLSLYSVHLPLDVHPQVGNNAQLARLLGLRTKGMFGDYHGVLLGVVGEWEQPIPLNEVIHKLEDILGARLTVLPHGPKSIKRVGIISGGAASLVEQAAQERVDLFLTGEPSHSAFHQVVERGLNVAYGGHYATETLGLKALAAHLVEKFQLEVEFLDIPTGF